MEQTYAAAKGVSAADVEKYVDELWADLQAEGPLRDAAMQLDAAQTVIGQPRESVIAIRRTGAGLDPGTTQIIVVFTTLAGKIAYDLWKTLLLPRIERRWGKKALTQVGESPSKA